MKYFILFAILGMAHLCHAQKLRRHEITLGYYAGYYFDEIPLRFQHLKLNKLNKIPPTITYKFKFTKKLNVSVFYGSHTLGGEKVYGAFIPPNTKLGRVTKHYTLRAGYEIRLGSVININLHTGLAHRRGFTLKYLYLYDHGLWAESFFEYKDFKDIGVLFEVAVQHKIYRNFFGELSLSLTHYRADFDQNLLMPGYRVGFRF